jgi:ATP-dependent Clp protease, protease subunit
MREMNRKMSHDSNSMFIDDGVDIVNRIIHLKGDIDTDSVATVMKGIQLCIVKSPDLPIDIYINSDGGDPYSAFGLYDFIRLQKVTINTHVVGHAMSAASVILMAGDTRTMTENSVLMLHTVRSGADGKVYPILDDETEECKKIHEQMSEIYGSRTKLDAKKWSKKIKYHNVFIRKDEALALGLVDKIQTAL